MTDKASTTRIDGLKLEVLNEPDLIEVDAGFVESLLLLESAARSGTLVLDDEPPPDLKDSKRVAWLASRRCLRQMYAAPSSSSTLQLQSVGQRIGRYEIERVIGHGGFSLVYLAWDHYLRRRAAVKIPRPHVLESTDLRQRFLREAQAVSQLDHPHIVPTYEAGEEGAIPYIAQAYCEGPTLAAWLRQQKLPVSPRSAAELLLSLAEAVSYSHSKGILHRDLKPGNVLMFPIKDVVADQFPYLARVSDFGLAKLIEADLHETATSLLMGTPRYMAPEQTMSQGAAIGPATDVYGLGAVLYEVLTGQPPFTAETAWDTLAQVRDYMPAAPRLLRPNIPRDLETICMTCLAKDPAERYQSAGLLAADLCRFLDGQPVVAHPIGKLHLMWRWCRRHKGIATSLAALLAVAVLLILGLIFHLYSVQRLGRDLSDRNDQLANSVKLLDATVRRSGELEGLASNRTLQLRRTLYDVELQQSFQAWQRGDIRAAVSWLQPFDTRQAGDEDIREFAWWYLWRQIETPELARIQLPAVNYFVKYSPQGDLVACAGEDSVLRIHATRDYKLIRELHTEQIEVNGIAFASDATWVATTGDDGSVAVWELPSGRLKKRTPPTLGVRAYQVQYSAKFRCLMVCGQAPDVRLFDIDTLEPGGVLTGCHTKSIEAIRLSADERRLLSCGADGIAAIWNVETRKLERAVHASETYLTACTWLADNIHFATTDSHGKVRIWNRENGELMREHQLLDAGYSVLPSVSGQLIVGDDNGAVSMFNVGHVAKSDPADFAPTTWWAPHKDRIYGMDLAPDGRTLATVSRDRQLVIQHVRPREAVIRQKTDGGRRDYFLSSAVGPDHWGRTYRISKDGIIVTTEQEHQPLRILPNTNHIVTIALHAGQLLAGDRQGGFHSWKLEQSLDQHCVAKVADSSLFELLPLNPNSVVLRCVGRELILWDLNLWQADPSFPRADRMGLSSDGRFMIGALDKAAVCMLSVYRTDSLDTVQSRRVQPEDVRCMTFGPGNRLIAAGCNDRSIQVFEAQTLKELLRLRGHKHVVLKLAISPDERTLASADETGSLRLWDLRTGRELFELIERVEPFIRLEFSASGDELWAVDARFEEFRWSAKVTSKSDTL